MSDEISLQKFAGFVFMPLEGEKSRLRISVPINQDLSGTVRLSNLLRDSRIYTCRKKEFYKKNAAGGKKDEIIRRETAGLFLVKKELCCAASFFSKRHVLGMMPRGLPIFKTLSGNQRRMPW